GRSSARQSQVDTVDDVFGAAIQATVDVEHPSDSLVHVLRGEAEHVIVEPVSAHGLVPVARNFIKATRVRWARRHYVLGGVVDGVTASEDDRVVIVVELVREEECASKAVVLRAVMPVMFVSRNRVHAKPAVLVLENGESVM